MLHIEFLGQPTTAGLWWFAEIGAFLEGCRRLQTPPPPLKTELFTFSGSLETCQTGLDLCYAFSIGWTAYCRANIRNHMFISKRFLRIIRVQECSQKTMWHTALQFHDRTCGWFSSKGQEICLDANKIISHNIMLACKYIYRQMPFYLWFQDFMFFPALLHISLLLKWDFLTLVGHW